MFILILTIIVVLIYLWNYTNYWKKRNVVQETGTLIKFTFGSRSLSEYYKDIYDKHDVSQIGIYLGSTRAIILKDLKDIQAVLASDFQHFYSRGINMNERDILADNILFIDEYQRWKVLRQKFSPAFTSLRLKTMFKGIEKSARDFLELIERDKSVLETPYNAVLKYTTASIGTAVFGVDPNQNTLDSSVNDVAGKVFQPSLINNIKFFISTISPTLFNRLNLKIFGRFEKVFINAVKKVLEKRRVGEKSSDFIDVCLTLQENGTMKDIASGYEIEPTDELLAAQAFFFFIAGADTSANSMHFTLLELASNPHILEKLHAEIDVVFGEKDILSFEDLEKMTYLEMVVNEALRKYPPIGLMQRLCTKDTVLPSNLVIEKDIVVVIPVLAIHRDEKYYPNSEIFDPERFDPEKVKEMNKFTYLPFGEGNRICIGARFARLQLKAGLAWLLRKYTLEPKKYKPQKFERSPFSVQDPKAKYNLIKRVN